MAGQRPSFSGYYDRPLYRMLFRWIDYRKVHVVRRALAGEPGGAVLVDIGSGSGGILERVARPDDVAVAVERDRALVEAAAARGLTAVRADFDAGLPFADDSVDAALMIDAIEHAVDPHRVLDELHRVLRPGGIAVLFTPPYDSVRWILAERFHHLVTRRPADHISPFTRESLSWAVRGRFHRCRFGRVNGNLSMYAIMRKADRPAGGETA